MSFDCSSSLETIDEKCCKLHAMNEGAIEAMAAVSCFLLA